MYKRVRQTNAWIERECGIVRLVSYNTLVCEVHQDTRTIVLSPAARYSRTTIRHLSEFLREFGVSYIDAKAVLIDPSRDAVLTDNGFMMYVSKDRRFRFRATSPYCLL